MHRIVGKLCGGWAAPLSAAACFALLPVVVDLTHEVKPHLPGMALVLLSVLAAGRYVQSGGWRAAAGAGALCGAAMGMILTGVVAGTVLPVMVLLRRDSWPKRLKAMAVAGAAMLICYVVTNPYVVIRLFSRRSLLAGNVAGLGGFYNLEHRVGALRTAVRLIAEGVSPGLLVIAMSGLVLFAIRGVRSKFGQVTPLGWLLLAPATATAVQVLAFAAGKPGEYGRFGLLTDVALAIAAVTSASVFVKPTGLRAMILVILPLCAAPAAWRYMRGFVADCGQHNSRMAEARRLQQMLQELVANRDPRGGPLILATAAESAPYCMPPVDLFRWQVILLPKGKGLEEAAKVVKADVFIQAADEPSPGGTVVGDFIELPPAIAPVVPPTVISWADKPFRVFVRGALLGPSIVPSPAAP